MALKDLLKITFTGVSPQLFEVLTGANLDLSDVIQEVALLASAHAPALGSSLAQIVASCTAFTYQDDDAHDTCTLTACLNPLHPGPCKGWKGTLHEVSPGAWHALEAARVEKANHTRLKKIEALKSAGKPIPHKLLTPIVAKPHPNAGKTANAATGEAHAAGKAVSDAAGVHVNEPGKVTLGQAIKPIPQNTGEKGPKGKKPSVMSKGIAFVIAQEKVTPQYKLDKAAQITPEQWNTLNPPDKAIIRAELAKIKKDGFGPQQKKADELLAKLPETKPSELESGTPGTITTPSGKVYQKIEPTKLSEVATPNTAVTSSEKPKPLPKHVEHAISMANGQAVGASWSKNHLAAYQPLTAEEFHALPKDTQGKIVTELTKGQSKFLDPKKIQASKDLLAKFGKGPATASTPKAEVPKAAEKTVGFSSHLHDHSVTQAQAKEAVAKTDIAHHFLAAKQTAGLTSLDNPDSPHHKSDALEKADQLVEMQTGHYADNGKLLDKPEVKAAVEQLGKAGYELKLAQSVGAAKEKAFNKIALAVTGDKTNDGGKLSPIEKASLEHYGKYLLNHDLTEGNPQTNTASVDKLQKDAVAAVNNLHDKMQAAKKQANAPKPEDMSPAQIADRAKELLGAEAANPKITLSLGELKQADSTGQHHADLVAGKYPPGVVTDPAVAAKHDALASADSQLIAIKAMKQKLDDHLTYHHGIGQGGIGTDVHGNPLTADDKKVIALHAEQLKASFAHLDVSQATQEKKLKDAKAAFHAAAAKAQGQAQPAELHKLSDYDKGAIEDAYTNAWTKHASSAVLYGVKTYSQKQDMKAHPEYAPLTQNLGDLKSLAGKLALAHAQEHTAQLNVPTNPETGDLEHGPEWDAWKNATSVRQGLESQFTVLHKSAQTKLDKIRTDVGLKKRALPKIDSAAVKATAAEGGFYKSSGYSGPNYGKPTAAKNYMLAKVGPKIAVAHKTATEKKLEKLGYGAGPSATTSKIENVVPGPTVKLGGADSSISHIPDPLKKQITSDFKAMPSGKYMSDPAEDIFGNLVTLAAAHGKTVPGGLSIDQVLKTIDETHSKNMGFENTGMLHKKITDWLGTANGKQYAESHSTADAKAVKQLTGEVALPKGVTLAPGEKVQPLAGPGAHDTSLSAKDFHAHTSAEAQAEQDAYKKAQGIVWTGAQKKAMTAYTGNGPSAYEGINNYLRGEGSFNAVVKQYAVDIQSAMMPLRENTLLKRGTGWPPGLASFASHPEDLLGKTFEDKGFVSSSVAGSGGHFSGKPLQLVIEAPKGTAAVFVNGISHYKGSENEMLLAAGTKFKVLSVDKTSGGHTLLRVRVVGDK